MPRRADLASRRAQLIGEINMLAVSIQYIASHYFYRAGRQDHLKASVDPKVGATMTARLADFRVRHQALMAQLDELDERVPELWYGR